jgi:hypothetical protein
VYFHNTPTIPQTENIVFLGDNLVMKIQLFGKTFNIYLKETNDISVSRKIFHLLLNRMYTV